MRLRTPLCGALAVITAAALATPAATAAGASPARSVQPASSVSDIRHAPDTKNLTFQDEHGKVISASQLKARLAASAMSARKAAAATGDTPVGTQRLWLAIDFVTGGLYLKNFVLRGLGDHIEVWTAAGTQDSTTGTPTSTDLQFLPGDCRNGVRTTVTDAQVDYLVAQYDNNILPKESKVFSVAPDRNGDNEQLSAIVGQEFDFSGGGDNVVTLVDNVRDENFYDKNNTQANTYVAGFFSSTVNALLDRNVMTIDGYDWLHRTGANPPNEPSTDLCTNAPARPFLYESVFAHEYQHLLESYADPEEVNWVNEGLSDFAQTVTGYVDTSKPITSPSYDSHIQCFLGYLSVATPTNTIPRKQCGPSNSLTLWGDQGDDNLLADYGAAYSMMEFLAGRYGVDFISALHRNSAEGFEGLQNVLDRFAAGTNAADVLHDWAAMIAVDKQLDRFPKLGARGRQYTTPTLHASVLWGNPEAYRSASDAPSFRKGAPPNGSDYVRLRGAAGPLSAGALESLSFQGAKSLPPKAVEWTVDASPAGHPSAALFSGTDNNLDRTIARQVTVPAGSPTLTLDTRWSTEPGFDSGFVQISTDGGKTWKSLGNADTTDALDPGADPTLVGNLPGFNGEGGWKNESFDLSAYAGKTVLLGFRYFSDANTNGEGWWIDNVSVGTTQVSDGASVAGWQTYTQVAPVPVHGYTVQLVSYTPGEGNVLVQRLRVDGDFAGSLNKGQLRQLLGHQASVVAAIVMFDDPSETADEYAPYRLTVNGVVQPGG